LPYFIVGTVRCIYGITVGLCIVKRNKIGKKKIMPFTTKVGHLAKLLSVRLFFSLSSSLMPPAQKNGAF